MVKAPQFSILPYVGVLAFMQLPNPYLDPDGWRWEMRGPASDTWEEDTGVSAWLLSHTGHKLLGKAVMLVPGGCAVNPASTRAAETSSQDPCCCSPLLYLNCSRFA